MKEALPQEEIARLMGGIDQPPDKRIAKAKELLKEAGVPDGFSAELIVRSEEPTELKPAVFAADLWKRYLNINVAIKPLDRAQFFDRRDQGLFDLAFEAATTSTGVSPSDFLSIFLTKSIRNYGKWSNSAYDQLTNVVQSESDPTKRIEAAQKAQRILYEDLPYICFHATTYATAWRPDLMTGWPAKKGLVLQPTYTNFPSIDRIWFDGTAKRWSRR
jgi:ABC-type oligopeptide transport system substrate-binding subunit